MNAQPIWWSGLTIYLIYIAIIFGCWAAGDVNYLNLASSDVIVKSLIVPFGLGTVFLVLTLSYLKWWRSVMIEQRPWRPTWVLLVILLPVVGFVAVNSLTTNWSAISIGHLALLILACVLIGFNEEALTRGILVVAWRGSTSSEALVWFFSTLLFALLHLPNSLFGIGLSGSIAQIVFTFLLGTGLYIARRISGTLLVPIALHAAWDFATFARNASGADAVLLSPLFQFSAYLLSIIMVIFVLRANGRTAQ